MDKRSKLAFVCFGIIFAFVIDSMIASAIGVQLICLRDQEVLKLSQCNPDMTDWKCEIGSSKTIDEGYCQLCVNEIRTGVYCQASPNDCNNGGTGGCTYLYEEQNATQQNDTEDLPIITLINPVKNYYQSEAEDIEFSFRVTESSKMEACSLIVNNEPVASKSHPIYLTTQKLYYTPLEDGIYEWNIECTEKDEYGGIIIFSESRIFYINETASNDTGQNDTETQYYDIILDSPADASALEGEQQVTFTYGLGENISQQDIQDCSLILDGNAVSISTDNSTQFSYNIVLGSHSWKIECSTLNNNLTSAIRTITINSPPAPSSGGGGGGGGGGSSAQTYTLSELQISSGYTKALKANDKIKFTIAKNGINETHTITATKISADSAAFQIKSNQIDATINLGETKKIDMDLDGVYDLSIILNKILNNRADITVQTISEKTESGESSEKEIDKEAQTTEESQGNSTGITAAVIGTLNDNKIPVFIVALTIICIIAVLFYPRKKKSKEQKE